MSGKKKSRNIGKAEASIFQGIAHRKEKNLISEIKKFGVLNKKRKKFIAPNSIFAVPK